MPLFECSKCRAVDNTALANFWTAFFEGAPLLCSECDPEINRWHGRFPKVTVEEYERDNPGLKVRYRLSA